MDKTFLHTYLMTRIKEHTNLKLVDKSFLKDEIGRVLIRKGGLPKFMVKYVIEDLVKLDLLRKERKPELYYLKDNPEEKKLKALISFL